jgi:hypothetical protein
MPKRLQLFDAVQVNRQPRSERKLRLLVVGIGIGIGITAEAQASTRPVWGVHLTQAGK